MGVPLDVYVDGPALLYLPNLSPNSYSPTKNDGFKLQLVLWFLHERCVGEMVNMMYTTQWGFYLDLYRYVLLVFLWLL